MRRHCLFWPRLRSACLCICLSPVPRTDRKALDSQCFCGSVIWKAIVATGGKKLTFLSLQEPTSLFQPALLTSERSSSSPCCLLWEATANGRPLHPEFLGTAKSLSSPPGPSHQLHIPVTSSRSPSSLQAPLSPPGVPRLLHVLLFLSRSFLSPDLQTQPSQSCGPYSIFSIKFY